MIERVHLRLCAWADELVGGYEGGSTGCLLGTLIDNPAAVTRLHRRKRRLCSETGQMLFPNLTAEGVHTRVSRFKQVDVKTASMEVDEAVKKLPEDLQNVVCVFYFEGGLAAKARAQKLKMSVATMYRRRDAAHAVLDSILYKAELPRVVETYPQALSQR